MLSVAASITKVILGVAEPGVSCGCISLSKVWTQDTSA